MPRLLIPGVLVVGLASALALTLPRGMTARQPRGCTPVTDERLRNPEPRNWLMYRRNYAGETLKERIARGPLALDDAIDRCRCRVLGPHDHR